MNLKSSAALRNIQFALHGLSPFIKAREKTYDRVAIDLGKGAFEHGQSYVALSPCRQLNGVYLKKKLTPRDIMVDETVVEFYERKR